MAALFAPQGTPERVVQRMSDAVAKVVAQPDVRERLSSLGFEPVGSAPGELRGLVARELLRWESVARRAGFTKQ